MKKKMKKEFKEELDDDKPEKRESKELFRTSEWARNNGLDPHLFVFWDREGLVDKDRFEEVKKKVMR